MVGTARACRAGVPTQSPARGAPDPAPHSGAALILIRLNSATQCADKRTGESRLGADCLTVSGASRTVGLFVPKPSTGRDCQRRSTPGLGQTVRGCPLASTAGGGDCHSLGHSVVCACAGDLLAQHARSMHYERVTCVARGFKLAALPSFVDAGRRLPLLPVAVTVAVSTLHRS